MQSLDNFQRFMISHYTTHYYYYYYNFFWNLFKHTCNSSVLCYLPHSCPSQIEKNIHSVCSHERHGSWETPPARTLVCVCVFVPWKKLCCSLLALSLSTFSAHYSPGGRALSVIVLEPTQATYAFPMRSSRISLSGSSRPASVFPQISFFCLLFCFLILLIYIYILIFFVSFYNLFFECLHKLNHSCHCLVPGSSPVMMSGIH